MLRGARGLWALEVEIGPCLVKGLADNCGVGGTSGHWHCLRGLVRRILAGRVVG